MARFAVGDVVIVPFPPSRATSIIKNRPALVVAVVPFGGHDDYMICLITSQNAADPYILPIGSSDIQGGRLNTQSYIRPTYMWTCEEGFITKRVGTLTSKLLLTVQKNLAILFLSNMRP